MELSLNKMAGEVNGTNYNDSGSAKSDSIGNPVTKVSQIISCYLRIRYFFLDCQISFRLFWYLMRIMKA